MATRTGKKNDAIFLVVLVLLLLLFGWLAWKLTTPSARPHQAAAQTNTNNYAPNSPISTAATPATNAAALSSARDFSAMPAITFTMPVSQPPPPPITPATQQPSAQTQATAAAQSTPATAQAAPQPPASPRPVATRPPPPKKHTTPARTAKSQRTATAQPTRPTNYVPPPDESPAVASAPRATTTAAPASPASNANPMAGSQIAPGAFAIIIAKQQDPATGRYLLAAVDGKTNLTYIYEVDAATYAEAAPSLMFSPAKVANWTFVSSR